MERQQFYEVPKSQQLFTTQDIAAIMNETTYAVGNARNFLGIKGIVKSVHNGRSCFFNYQEMKQIKELLESRQAFRERIQQQQKPKVEPKTESLDALKKQHPLIKDVRCFRISWWPETVPECFAELED